MDFEKYGLTDEEIHEALLSAARNNNTHEYFLRLQELRLKETGMTAGQAYQAFVERRNQEKNGGNPTN